MKIGSRAGVGKDVIDLFESLRGVDGNVDRAETQNREIGDGPLRTILGEQCDPVSRPDAKSRQSESDIFDALDESCCRDVVPLALAAVIESVFFVVTQDSREN